MAARVSTLFIAMTLTAVAIQAERVMADPAHALAPAVSALRTEHQVRPLGLDETAPRFGWQIDSSGRGIVQSAYEIRVSTRPGGAGPFWQSGKVTGARPFDVVYAGPPLSSNMRYYWSVRVWTNDGRVSPWAAEEWFETAFLPGTAFPGEWIGRTARRGSVETPAPLLRRQFAVAGTPVAARLHIVGLGLYKAWVNGRPVSTSVLDPPYTPYDRRIDYQTFDVTPLIDASATNVLGVTLGRGTYAAYGDSDISDAPWLAEPKVKLDLELRYGDGRIEHVLSGADWRASDGPTLRNSVKYGETYDARREQPGWTTARFDASDWDRAVIVPAPSGALVADAMEPMRIVGEMRVPVLSTTRGGNRLYDFRQTRAGWAAVRLKGRAGDEVKIALGEKLKADGSVNAGGDGPFGGTPVQTYTYILRGDPAGETFEPSFSYAGFRFAELTAPRSVTVQDVRGRVVNNAVARTGAFHSSDPLLNRYHEAMVTSLLSNMHGIPTDTPMYEKRGWTADTMLSADSSLMNLASENFLAKWMRDHRDNQAPDGGIAQIVPNENPGGKQEDPFVGSTEDPIWSSSYVLVNHALYWQRGDRRVVERNYSGMVQWMDKWITEVGRTGYVFRGKTWGDHEPAYGAGTNNSLVASAYLVRSARALAEMARVLGKGADATRFESFAARVGAAINTNFYNNARGTYNFPYHQPIFAPPPGTGAPADAPGGASAAAPAMPQMPPEMMLGARPEEVEARQFQTNNILPLRLNLVPAAGRARLCASLLRDVGKQEGMHVTTGAIVLKDALPVITDCGGAELAYRAATNPIYPGWGYWFRTLDGSKGAGGETIIVDTHWEAWGAQARSHNHAFRGTIDDWLYNDVAGITPDQPGYAVIRFRPHVLAALGNASAAVLTPYGPAGLSWNRVGDGVTLRVTVPVGAEGRVFVPAAVHGRVTVPEGARFDDAAEGYREYRIGSGTYVFRSQ